MVPLAVEAGFTWMATDEEILGRSLAHHLDRDDRGQVRAPELLYRPYQVGGQIACGFRDHALSDLIGFSYASWPADDAARDFTQRLVDAGRHYAARTGGHDATIFVILDGENAWEHYDGQGRPFLRALYGRLTSHPELQTVTMAEACAPSSNQTALPSIFPGSWINGDFYIWIGHDDDRRAWSQLGDARRALDAAAPRLTPTQHDTAYEELLIAEGSDWYWWYGDDHSSSHDAAFDELFRRHLRNVYRTIDTPTPAELFTSNITTAATPRVGEPPLCEVSPSIDGQHTSYFEWVGAGQLALKAPVGAMHEVTAEHTWCTALTYGLDGDALVLALSGPEPMKDLIGDRLRVGIALAAPIERLVLLDEGSGLAAISVGHIIEARLPGPLVGLATGSQHCAFFVTLHERGSNRELARLPEGSPIEITRQAGGLSAWP
jgi:alpha-amylase/alpha-mannosidase (GH57 family)